MTKGCDQTIYDTRKSTIGDISKNYFLLLLDLAQKIPDGIVVYFPNFT